MSLMGMSLDLLLDPILEHSVSGLRMIFVRSLLTNGVPRDIEMGRHGIGVRLRLAATSSSGGPISR